MKSVFLLTGKPGTGKTTVIKKALSHIKISAGGFYTEEIRSSGIRKGFKIITLDGSEAMLSHTDFSSPFKVGKYHVNIENLDNTGVKAILEAVRNAGLIIIDEIGKMEILSPAFRDAVLQAINSNKRVLGTIMLNPNPFADKIKKDPGVKLITVTASNRDKVLEDLIEELSRQ